MNVFKTSLLATALIAAGAIAPAHAETATDTFDVTITIDKSCNITSTADVAFASQTAAIGTATAQGGVTLQCTLGTDYTVALNGGLHSGNDITAREMLHTNGTDGIAYDLLQTAGGDVWGESIGTNTIASTGTGFGTGAPFDKVHTVFAEATITGTEPAGNYSDTITATVTF